MCVCVCVCVCEERERERERSIYIFTKIKNACFMYVFMSLAASFFSHDSLSHQNPRTEKGEEENCTAPGGGGCIASSLMAASLLTDDTCWRKRRPFRARAAAPVLFGGGGGFDGWRNGVIEGGGVVGRRKDAQMRCRTTPLTPSIPIPSTPCCPFYMIYALLTSRPRDKAEAGAEALEEGLGGQVLS